MSTITVPAERVALVQGIRELADFLEAHPEIPNPRVWARVWSHTGGSEAFRAACDAMRPNGFTVGDRGPDEIEVSCEFAGGVNFKVAACRDRVCEQRTTVREVTEHVLPEWCSPASPAEASA